MTNVLHSSTGAEKQKTGVRAKNPRAAAAARWGGKFACDRIRWDPLVTLMIQL